MNDGERYPFVSVIMPVRNEVQFIRQCLDGFLHQTYPPARFEIIIADKSEDGTRNVLEDYAKKFPDRVKVLANPSGRIADGYNLALGQAQGEIVANYVGHAFPDPRYLEEVARALAEERVDMVGGRVVPLASVDTRGARAIAAALKSPFAVGANAYTRQAKCEVVSTHWMAVKRKWIERTGGFDARLTRGEDCDWYERMIAAGATSYFDPAIVSYYYPRETYSKQCRIQMLNAWHRLRLFFLTGRGMRLRHIAPVLAVVGYAVVSTAVLRSALPILCPLAFYLAALCAVSLTISKPQYRLSPHHAAAVVSIHAGHFLGMLGGLLVYGLPSLRWIFRSKK